MRPTQNLKFQLTNFFNSNKLIKKIKQHRLAAALIVVLWFFLFFTTITKAYFFSIRQEGAVDLDYIFLRALLIWGIVVLFSPLFIMLAKKFPIDRRGKKYNILIHLLFSVLFVPLHAVLYSTAIMAWYTQTGWSWTSFSAAIPVIIYWLIFIAPLNYWLIIGAYYLKKYYDQYKKRQFQNAELEAELASIKLNVLKVQLHPHFLFNTLHNINSLIYENPDLAVEVLELLKKMLRKSADNAGQQEVRLNEEMEFTRTYLEIEKTRFGKDLDVEIDIEERALNCYVPNLILQPLVENSVKHGISQKSGPGKVMISARIVDGHLLLRVEDNGPGLNGSRDNLKLGIGLKNNMQRLEHLYEDYEIDLSSSRLGGAKVEIRIPVKTAKAELQKEIHEYHHNPDRRR